MPDLHPRKEEESWVGLMDESNSSQFRDEDEDFGPAGSNSSDHSKKGWTNPQSVLGSFLF